VDINMLIVNDYIVKPFLSYFVEKNIISL